MYKKLIKDILIYGAGTVLPRLINIVFTYFFTTIFTNKEFANINDVFLFDVVMVQVLTFGFETAIFRFASNKENTNNVMKTAFLTVGFFVLLFLIVGVFFYPELAAYRNYPPEYALFAILIITSDTLLALGYTYLRLQEKPVKFSLLKLLNVLAYAFFLIGVLGMSIPLFDGLQTITDRPGIALLGTLIASVSVFLILIPEFFHFLRKGIYSFELTKQMIKFGSPIAIAAIAYSINETFDKINMKEALGETITGAYGACYKLGMFVMLYEMAFRMGIEPFFFKQMNSHNKNTIYSKAVLYYTFLGSILYVGVIANLDWLKDLIIGNKSYLIALNIVPVILMANLVLGVYRNISIWYKVIDKTYFGMFFSIIGVVVTLSGNLLVLKYTKDYMIAAWTTLAAYGIMLVVSYLCSRKYNAIPYEINKILFYLLASGVISFMIFKLDLGLIINNIILIIYLIVILLIEFKTIKQLIKK